MPERRPQINFQVDESMKLLYEEAKANGHWVTRLCAAGLLLMVEDPEARQRACNRLIEWEARFAGASAGEIRAFVQGASVAMRGAARESSPARTAPRSRKKARGAESG